MAFVFENIRGICTDFGTEVRTIELPDILRALLAWMDGRELVECRTLVNYDRRLFYRALRMSGWSHTMGNLQKMLVSKDFRWERFLPKLRALCSFWHNVTWRKHVQKRLPADSGLRPLLDHFTASLATWRYETVDDVFMALTQIRRICQDHVRMELFNNPQDRELVRAAVDACHDRELWTYIVTTGREISHPTEGARHWGMVCGCEEHVRERHEGAKHQKCMYNGRRLSESWDFICREIDTAKDRKEHLTIEDCDGSQEEFRQITAKINRTISGLKLRMGYIGVVPWRLGTAGTVAGALECLNQVRSKPLEEHDPLTQDFMRRLGGDLEQRSQGGDVTPALQDEIDRINLCPMDESSGEGYHRATTAEHTRALASSTHHLAQHNRSKLEMDRVRLFIEKGEPGRRVVRYEWRCWKRLLQTQWRKRWDPTRDTAAEATKRIYHEDGKAEDDWTSIVRREDPVRPVVTEDPTTRSQLESEYVSAVLRPDNYFAVPERVENVGEKRCGGSSRGT